MLLAGVTVTDTRGQTPTPGSGPVGPTPELGPPRDEAIWAIHESLWTGPAVGEAYTLEVGAGLWSPSPSISASSEQFGIIGTRIDFGRDLGLVRQTHGELRLVLKPARRHKFRLHWVPMRYQQNRILDRDLVFQGIRYPAGAAVTSTMSWDAWRFGYEFDLIVRSRGYLGLIVEAKYTDVRAELSSPQDSEFTRAQAPIPAVGAIGRIYVTRFTPLTAEFTAFRTPTGLVDEYDVRIADFDVYATVNLTRQVGLNLGYRTMDLSYLVERETGDFAVKGLYLSGTFRF